MESLFSMVGTWLGFVGACVAGGGPACRPFLAFVALTSSASVALTLLVLAYRSLMHDFGQGRDQTESGDVEFQRGAVRPRVGSARVLRGLQPTI